MKDPNCTAYHGLYQDRDDVDACTCGPKKTNKKAPNKNGAKKKTKKK